MKSKMIYVIIVITLLIFTLTGCTSAETVDHNLSREADEFKVRRRITFINLIDNTYLFQMTGNCSIQGGESDLNGELNVICKVGDGRYQKHMLKTTYGTTYVVEQLEYNDVSRYDYELVFRPEAIVPIKIKTQIGEE